MRLTEEGAKQRTLCLPATVRVGVVRWGPRAGVSVSPTANAVRSRLAFHVPTQAEPSCCRFLWGLPEGRHVKTHSRCDTGEPTGRLCSLEDLGTPLSSAHEGASRGHQPRGAQLQTIPGRAERTEEALLRDQPPGVRGAGGTPGPLRPGTCGAGKTDAVTAACGQGTGPARSVALARRPWLLGRWSYRLTFSTKNDFF